MLFIFSFFLAGFLGADFVNRQNSYYTATFEVENAAVFDVDKLSDCSFLESIKASADKYKNINVEKMLEKNDFQLQQESETMFTITTAAKYYDTFFNSQTKSVGTRAKTFIKDSVDTLCQDLTTVTYADSVNIVVLHRYINPYWIALFAALGGLIISFIFLSIVYFCKEDEKKEKIIYDNEKVYKSIFHRSYFKQALHSIKGIRDMSNLAMLFAMMMLCKFLKMPSGFADLGISFTYLFFAISAMIYGPFVGFVVGIFSDVIGYVISPSGVFFPPYILQAAFSGMIYGFCFYKTSISFGKTLLARTLINFLMNVIYGSFCFGWMYGYNKEVIFSYMLLVSLPKNLVYLLPQSILLYYVIKVVSPILYHFRLMDEKIYKNMHFVQ